MNTTSTRRRVAVVAALAAAAVIAPAAGASAQLPGAVTDGRVVIVDGRVAGTQTPLMTVTVNDAPASAASVSGTIKNNGTASMRCAVPGNGTEYPGQVTEAQIVKDSMEFYASTIYQPPGFPAPVVGNAPTGSLYNMLPTGSGANALGRTDGLLLQIRAAQEAARVAGHTGTPVVGSSSVFTVAAGATSSWSAPLGVATTNTRTDFAAAALFICTSGSNTYAFAGYEGGAPPADEIGRLSWS